MGATLMMDEIALQELAPKIRGFLATRVSDPSDAEDLAQEILMKLHQRGHEVSDTTRLHAWIWAVARNTVVDFYRRRRPATVDLAAVDIEDARIRFDSSAAEDDVLSWLAPMIAQLPEPYRDAVRMSELEGVPQAEVAARLSIGLSGAKSRIQRGRARLREILMKCCEFERDEEGRIAAYRRVGAECVVGGCAGEAPSEKSA